MSARHLSCTGCRIRVRANIPEIGLLEGNCPICGVTLVAVPFPSAWLGSARLIWMHSRSKRRTIAIRACAAG